jgi:hypothetical protein
VLTHSYRPEAKLEGKGGGGLLVVARVARAWGIDGDPEGKVIWCTLQTFSRRRRRGVDPVSAPTPDAVDVFGERMEDANAVLT